MRLVRLLSDMSASYGSISPLEYDAEKALTLGDGDAHALTLGDVSGMLPDDKESDYSSFAPSSASSDTESVGGEEGEYLPSTARVCTSPSPRLSQRTRGVVCWMVGYLWWTRLISFDLSSPFYLP
jgi:hypothetical protein